ncbi:MAG: hypothetical protein ACU0A6_14045 [Shimia sp.]|uniref:hypothetical protein n=1 Tax=Shimia sp. TaxID=1954381 RepID=UPI00405A37E7
MLNALWEILSSLFAPIVSGKQASGTSKEVPQVDILKLWQKKNGAGGPTLWAEVHNPGAQDLIFGDLMLLLMYTAHPGGGLMQGGHATMALTISLPQSNTLPIPAHQTTTLCLYGPGDVVEIAPPKKRADARINAVLERDHLRFLAANQAEGHLLGALTVDPQATWMELRVPDRRRRDANAGRMLRHDSYRRPTMR